MKKNILIFTLVTSFLLPIFATNPETDFEYHLRDDNESVVINGFKKKLNKYEFPETIEGFPVTAITLHDFTGFEGITAISFKLPNSLKEFYLHAPGYMGLPAKPNSRVVIENLPESLVSLSIDAGYDYKNLDDFYLKIKGNIMALSNLNESVWLGHCMLESTKIEINAKMQDSIFGYSNIEEVLFKDDVNNIGSFYYCKKLKKVTLPATRNLRIKENAFNGCSNLTEIVIPDGLTSIEKIGYDAFTEVPLNLKTKSLLYKLEEYGMNGTEYFRGEGLSKISSNILKRRNDLQIALQENLKKFNMDSDKLKQITGLSLEKRRNNEYIVRDITKKSLSYKRIQIGESLDALNGNEINEIGSSYISKIEQTLNKFEGLKSEEYLKYNDDLDGVEYSISFISSSCNVYINNDGNILFKIKSGDELKFLNGKTIIVP